MFGVSDKGFKRKTYDDILTEMIDKSREAFGENINVSSKSLFGMFLRLTSWVLSGVWKMAENVYLGGYVRYAEGVQLDRIASNIGLKRQRPTKAKGWVNVYLSELPGTIPKGFIVESLTGHRYITVIDEQIEKQGAAIRVEAIEAGAASNAPANSIKEIVTPYDKVDEVNNLEAILGGEDLETDKEFRKRYHSSLSAVGSGTTASIEATLRNLDEVAAARVIENNTLEPKGDVPPHFIKCTVLGSNDYNIGKAILSTKAAGIGTIGDTEVDIDGYKVFYDKGEYKQIDITIQVERDQDYSDVYEEDIKKEIEAELITLGLGDTIYRSRLVMALNDIPGINNVNFIIEGKADDYTLGTNEVPRLGELVFEYV